MLLNVITALSVVIAAGTTLMWYAERKWNRDVEAARKMGCWHD